MAVKVVAYAHRVQAEEAMLLAMNLRFGDYRARTWRLVPASTKGPAVSGVIPLSSWSFLRAEQDTFADPVWRAQMDSERSQ